MSCKKIVIIGAPRSGTNMLRDVLTKIPNLGTWPCDEINYIWRYGNARYPTDEFPVNLAKPDICNYINNCFDLIATKQCKPTVIEKTCANSLRVKFVNRVLPDTKYIFLYRDGRDSIISAMKRWKAPLDIHYILKKVKYVPLGDLPYYVSRYLISRVNKIFSNEKRLSTWGPRFNGMDQMSKSSNLLEICATQWSRCIEKALDDLETINPKRIFKIKYEDFVMNPKEMILSLSSFLDVTFKGETAQRLVKSVTPTSVGNWKNAFKQHELEIMEPIIKGSMQRLGYY